MLRLAAHILGHTRIKIAVIAVAGISFLFIHEYQPLAGVVTNVFIGEIYLTDECPLKTTKDLYTDALIRKLAIDTGYPSIELQVSHNVEYNSLGLSCSMVIPYRWIITLAALVATASLLVRSRR